MNYNILAIGPEMHNSGQAHAFHSYSKEIDADVCTYKTRKIWLRLLSIPMLFFKLTRCKYKCTAPYDYIYVCFSRSRVGMLRDFWICFLSQSIFPSAKILNHVHGADFENFYCSVKGTFFERIFKYIYTRVSLNIVLDRNESSGSLPNYVHRQSMPNYIDIEKYQNHRSGSNNKKIRVLYFSNLCSTKGINAFLRICKVAEKDPKLDFTIAGKIIQDGKTDIKLLNRELSALPAKTSYVGVIDKQVVPDFLQNFDVLLFPSSYKSEAFPISVLEALASGLAVYSKDTGYIKSWLGDYCNFVSFESEDDINLINAIKAESERRLIHLRQFDIRQFKKDFEALIKNA